MGPKGLLHIFVLLSPILASSLLKRTIHADGSRDFTIVKHIKQNTCSCSCKCVPDAIAEQWLSDHRKPINQIIDDAPASSAVLEAILGPSTKEELTKAHNEEIQDPIQENISQTVQPTKDLITQAQSITTTTKPPATSKAIQTTSKFSKDLDSKSSENETEWTDQETKSSLDNLNQEADSDSKDQEKISASSETKRPTLKVKLHENDDKTVTVTINQVTKPTSSIQINPETTTGSTLKEVGSNVDQPAVIKQHENSILETTVASGSLTETSVTSLPAETVTIPSHSEATTRPLEDKTESTTEPSTTTTIQIIPSTSPSTTKTSTKDSTKAITKKTSLTSSTSHANDLETKSSTRSASSVITSSPTPKTTEKESLETNVPVTEPSTSVIEKIEPLLSSLSPSLERTTISTILVSEPVTIQAIVENTTHKELPPRWKNLMDRLRAKLEELKNKKIAQFLANATSTTTTLSPTTSISETTESFQTSTQGALSSTLGLSSKSDETLTPDTQLPSSPSMTTKEASTTNQTTKLPEQSTEATTQTSTFKSTTEISKSTNPVLVTSTEYPKSTHTSKTALSEAPTTTTSSTTKELSTTKTSTSTTTESTITSALIIDKVSMKTTETHSDEAFVTASHEKTESTETPITTTAATTTATAGQSKQEAITSKSEEKTTNISSEISLSSSTISNDNLNSDSTSTISTTITTEDDSSTGLEIAFKTEAPIEESSTQVVTSESTESSDGITVASVDADSTTTPLIVFSLSPKTETSSTEKVNQNKGKIELSTTHKPQKVTPKKPKQAPKKAVEDKEYSYEVDPEDEEDEETQEENDNDSESYEEEKTKPKKKPVPKKAVNISAKRFPTTKATEQIKSSTSPSPIFSLPRFQQNSKNNTSVYEQARKVFESQGMNRPHTLSTDEARQHTDMVSGLIRGIIGEAKNVLNTYSKIVPTETPSLGTAFVTELPSVMVGPAENPPFPLPVAHGAPTFNQENPIEQEIASFGPRKAIRVEPFLRVTTQSSNSFKTSDSDLSEDSDLRRTQALDAGVMAEKKRLEEARRLREEQFRIEQLHEHERQEQIREEMKKRRDEMIKQLEELKEAERRQKELLDEKEKLAEEAQALIAQRKALASANSDEIDTETSTNPNTVVRYKLKPSQCAAINKFTRVFKISDPSDWIQRNCQFAKRYFPQASCSQIQSLIESCFVFL